MALKKRQHSPEIRENDIGPKRKLHTAGKLFKKLDFVGAAIGAGHLARNLNYLSWFDGKDSARAELACKHRKNARPRADFHDNSSLANGFSEGLPISFRADAVCDHRAVGA